MKPIYKQIPEDILSRHSGKKEAVTNVVIHPPGTHSSSPIRNDMSAVEVYLADGSRRWYGTEKAWITSRLTIAMQINPKDEVLSKWETYRGR